MPDYKELYFKIFQASEQAINILLSAQRKCEDPYICSPEPKLRVIALLEENKKGADEV